MAPLDGGIVDNIDESSPAFKDSQTPYALNVDFDRGSVATARGMRKFGNQVAPSSALRFRCDPALPPLFIESGKAVPIRGYGYIGYNPDTDIGGRPDFEGTFPTSDTYHNRRGRPFQRDFSIRIPPEEKLFEAETRGAAAPTGSPAGFTPPHGFDEALDECTVLWQKGGDRAPPMSIALAVVNIGKLSQADSSGCQAPASRPSNYALCFIWFDAPAWARPAPSIMDYNLTSGFLPTDGANGGQHCTQAFRALLIHQFVEPGKVYHVSVQLKLDSGTQGGIATNTAWNHDGYFKVWVREDRKKTLAKFAAVDGPTSTSLLGMEVWKGPQDSARYLTHYGIRYFGRDATFLGLGMRTNPWQHAGFIPWGSDACPLSDGGFRMTDRSSSTITTLYGGGVYTLTALKVANGDAFVEINHGGFSDGNTNGGFDPMAIWGGAVYTSWLGQGNAAGSVPFNSEALRGYRLVATNDWAPGAPAAKGALFSILSYARVTGPTRFQVTIQGGATINSFAAQPVLVQAFRWHQRQTEGCEFRTWSTPRDYEDANPLIAARRKLSLGMSICLDDATEPDIENLLEHYPCDDSGGTVIREKVRGGPRNGFLCPQGLGVSDGGTRGKNLVFLSGEGEKAAIDFSTNPIVQREIQNILRSGTQGFAMEITCIFTEAFYGIQGVGELLPDSGGALSGSRPRFAPEIMSWDVKDAVHLGSKSTAKTLMALTFRGLSSDISSARFKRPLAPSVEIASLSDQEDANPIVPSDLLSWYTSGGLDIARYDQDAGWVGKPVTLQVGFQPVPGSADTYDVYLALTPKDLFNPQSGDPGDAEFAYWTAGGGAYDVAYKTAAHFTIKKKDIPRSVITIGGKHNPAGLGMQEVSARMLLDEVRIYATSGPGALPITNGGVVIGRDGKLEGTKCLPPRELSAEELLLPLGRNVSGINATERSATVTPAGSSKFFPGLAATSIDAAADCLLYVGGDKTPIPAPETDGLAQPDLYRVASVAADGSSLILATPYAKPSRSNAQASVLRTIAYTSFGDSISEKALTVGAGKGYDPATSTVADVILSEDMWLNRAPINNNFKVHVFPLGVSIKDTLPRWVRGLVSPRRGRTGEGIIGLHTQDSTVYAAVRGSIFRAYDRWVDAQPTQSIDHGLEFIREKNQSKAFAGVSVPEHNDRVEFESTAGFTVSPSATDATVTYFDWRGRVDDFSEYQTVAWVGARDTDPSKFAGIALGQHRVYVNLRLNRGRPEIAFGSSAYYTGTTQPEKGLFIATGAAVIQRGVDVHVRFGIKTRALGTIMQIPYLWVNGKLVTVTVNARDNDASITQATDFLRMSTLVPPGDNGIAMVGAGRDSYRAAPSAQLIPSAGEQLRGQRLQGILHGFAGTLYEFVVFKGAVWTGTTPPNFDPFTVSYTGATVTFSILGQTAEGRGAKVKDVAGNQYGVVRSSPFISVFHELGQSTNPVGFGVFNADLYAANGGRPVLVVDGEARFAGVQAPTTKPSFTLTRLPLWQPNVRDGASFAAPNNDPLNANMIAGGPPRNHYRSDGNSYLKAMLSDGADAAAMTWAKDKYFAFKTLWKPQQVAGRQSIWRKGASQESGGPFVECRDGHLYVGWYDVNLKENVDVHTDIPVFRAGETYLVHVRKRWPNQDAAEWNFENSYFTDGRIRRWALSATSGLFQVGETLRDNTTGLNVGRVVLAYPAANNTVEVLLTGIVPVGHVIQGLSSGVTANYSSQIRPMHDLVIVKHFPKTFVIDPNLKDPLDYTPGVHRSAVSFTSGAPNIPGTTATGLVTLPGVSFTGAAAGIVNSDQGNLFTPDHIGMYFQFASGTFAGRILRVQTWNTAAQIKVADETGAFPNLAGQVNLLGGVFSGVNLVKSARFDQSTSPDVAPIEIEMFGSSSAADPVKGLVPGLCEWWSPGYVISPVASGGTNGQVFENVDTSVTGAAGADPALAGTDPILAALYDATGGGQCGPLRCDDGKAFWTTDMQTYAAVAGDVTTQPNTDRKVESDPHAPNVTPTNTASATGDPVFTYLQSPALWSGQQFIAIAFRDPFQDIVSNPGPPPDPESNVLRLSPAAEDTLNPAGMVRVNLKSLPVSRDEGEMELVVFRSASGGDAAAEFEVLRMPSGTSEASMNPLELVVKQGEVLEFDNGAPPACLVVEMSQGRMLYAGLVDLDQPDGVFYSKVFEPGKVPGLNFFRVNTGPGSVITGMQEINGQLIVTKTNDVYSITFDPATGLPIQNTISGGASCVASQSLETVDRQLFMRGDRGVYVVQFHPYHLNLFATWASPHLQTFFDTLVDRLAASSSSATQNRRRNQYVLTVKLAGHSLTDHRVALMAGQEIVCGRYQDPNITALASLQPAGGGPRRVIGGTEEGFVLWMDDESTALLGIGPDQGADGSSELTVQSGASLTAARFSSGNLDQELEGPRGLPLRWVANGARYSATALGVQDGVLLLDQPAAVAPSGNATVGGQEFSWETRFIDCGNFEKRKLAHYLDLAFAKSSHGLVQLDFFTDRDGQTVAWSEVVDIAAEKVQVKLQRHAHWHKVRIRNAPLSVGGSWELLAIVWRAGETDQV